MPAKKSKSDTLVDKAFHEVYTSKPRAMGKNQTKAQARAQLTAIALSKAREQGADIPKPPKKRGSKSSY